MSQKIHDPLGTRLAVKVKTMALKIEAVKIDRTMMSLVGVMTLKIETMKSIVKVVTLKIEIEIKSQTVNIFHLKRTYRL